MLIYSVVKGGDGVSTAVLFIQIINNNKFTYTHTQNKQTNKQTKQKSQAISDSQEIKTTTKNKYLHNVYQVPTIYNHFSQQVSCVSYIWVTRSKNSKNTRRKNEKTPLTVNNA